MTSRKANLAGVAAMGSLLIMSAPAGAADLIRCVYPFWFGFAPVPVAIEMGYFAEEDLEVTTVFDNDRANVLPAFESGDLDCTMRTIGEKIPPKCLVLIETTVAPGTTEFVAWPILKKAFAVRGLKATPLLSHSFERVMPGREYVASIRDFWRVCSGCNATARKRVDKFLREVLNTED